MRLLCLLLLTALVSCAKNPTPSSATPGTGLTSPDCISTTEAGCDTTSIPFDPEIRRGQLDNGLKYFVKTNQKPEGWGEFWLFVKAGSLQEDNDQLGLAHLLEHMAFNGTTHYPGQELIAAIENTGAKFGPHLNAHTNWHETIYKVHLPTDDPKHLDMAMRILSDWAQGMQLDGEEIDKERGVVLDEWRRRLGVGERLSSVIRPDLFGPRYTDRWTIGTEESLKTFEHEAVRRYYQDWYRPELMAVAAVGDFDENVMVQKITETFSTLNNPEKPRALVNYEPTFLKKPKVHFQTDDELTRSSLQVYRHIAWSWQDTEAAYRDRMIEGLFYSMLNQRLQTIAQLPDPPYIGAGARRSNVSDETAYEYLSMSPKPGRMKQGFKALLTELERIRRFGFTETELERAKTQSLRRMKSLLDERENTTSKAQVQELKRHFIDNETVPGIQKEYDLTTHFLPQIQLAHFSALQQDWLAEDGWLTIVRQSPRDPDESITEDELHALLDEVHATELVPYTENVLPDTLMEPPTVTGQVAQTVQHEDIGVTEWVLSNGLRVLFKPTDFQEDEVRFQMSSWGGHSLASAKDYPSAAAAVAAMRRSGLANFEPTDMLRMLNGKKISVRPYISETRQGVSGSFSPKDAETAFQLMHLFMQHPRFDTQRLATYVEDRKSNLETRQASPETRYGDRKREVAYANHPRRIAWTQEMYDQIELETAKTFYQERFANPGNMTAVFVGNIGEDVLLELLLTYWGGLSGSKQAETFVDIEANRVKGVHKEVIHAGREDKARVELTFHGPFEKNRATDFVRSQLVQALRKKLRLSLREENSGTYGVSVSSSSYWVPKEQYTLSIRFTCESARVEELTDILFAELRDIVANPIDSEQVRGLQHSARKDHQKRLLTNGFWLNGLDWRLRYDKPLGDILANEEYVAALTAKQIQDMAKELINFEQYMHFVLVPEQE